MKLTDREWKEFFIKDIFYVKGTFTTKPQDLIVGGNTPRITCASTNNGLDDLYQNAPTEKGKVITIDSATIGFTSYQGYDFIATDHVEKISLKNRDMNIYMGLFLKQTVDSAIMQKYNYGYKFSQTRIKKQKILLPITADGQPDYKFMEDYIKEIMHRKRQEYIDYAKVKLGQNRAEQNIVPLESKKWKEFFIESVFSELRASKSGIDKNKLLETRENAYMPYITRSDIGNGVSMFVGKEQNIKYKSDSGNVISIGLDTQTVFYQPHSFFTGQNIQVISDSNINESTALFLTLLLKKQLQKFCWGGNGATLGRLRKTKILLPVTMEGKPDYEYMEEYVKNNAAKKYQEYLDYAESCK